VVARVGDHAIRVADIEEELTLRQERGTAIPQLPVLLDDLIDRRILVEKAQAEGLDKDPEVRRSWENLLIGRYKENHLRNRLRELSVTDEEVAERYAGDADRYRRPAKARLAILSLPFTPVMSDGERQAVVARMAEAKEKASSATEGPGFGLMATEYSEDQVTRNRGGDTGWLDEGVDYRWPKDVVQAGFALNLGVVSDPLVTRNGVFLVKKTDERPASQIPLEQVQDQIRKELLTARIREVEESFAEGLREGIEIATYPQTLAGIHVPAPSRKSATDEEEPPAIP
jgi:hypothetical protein